MNSHTFDELAWSKLDIFNQMGNIGSEVGRAFTAKKTGKTERVLPAFYRGVDLLNCTIDTWAGKNNSYVREILLARELFATSILTDQLDPTLERYFHQFALAARRNK
jgi:hypothetical protein